MNDRHLPDWDDNQLSLGRPAAMSTSTLIEWIQRQLETDEETTQRLERMREKHIEWHSSNPGIWVCCMFRSPVITVNEKRGMDYAAMRARTIEALTAKDNTGKIMVLPENVSIHHLY